ncbi:MAG: hypothetical protein CL607_15405 [Anaerolineaceae bacterium]|nr:hypothetical protein [Anaerolineaceae bacterium]
MIAGLFIVFRRIERWLHQHIFKVGWLLTQNYETTTILYYTFFLPGIILHEVIYWLVAGLLDVRAERSIKWPERQEVGELHLNFVQLARRTGRIQKAIISAAPLISGLVIVWLMATHIFDIAGFMTTISSGDLNDVSAGFSQLLGTPDFWLWFYILFTISNTMFPHLPKDLQGWRAIIASLAVAAAILVILGIGNAIFAALSMPITTSMSVIEGTLVLIIGVNVVMVLALGGIEYVVERVTGRSATFRRGKMITMTRVEAIEARDRERERQRAAQARRRAKAEQDAIIPSIYHLTLPVPGAPGDEPIIGAQPRLLDIDEPDDETDVDELESGEVNPRLGASTISRQSEQPQRTTRPSTLSLPGGRNALPAEDGKDEDDVPESTSARAVPLTTSVSDEPDLDDEDDNTDDGNEEDEKAPTSTQPVNPFATRPTAGRPTAGSSPVVPIFSASPDEDEAEEDDELVYEDIDDDYEIDDEEDEVDEDDAVPDEPF